MRVFFLDLWYDLREKRLAPVALLLIAGIIAVPIVLGNDSSAPPAPAPTTTTTAAAAAPVVQSATEATTQSSKLQTFNPRDPFEPTAVAASTSGGSTPAASSTGSDTGTNNTGENSTSSSGTPTDTSGGGATTGTEPSTGTGTTGTGTGSTGNTTGETKTTLFTYTTDLRFGKGSNMKKYSSVRRLELIPSEDNPKIVFLGVTATGKTAVFLVDSNIGVDTGEGRCRPSNDECTFLYLRPDADHDQATLTDSDGTVYHLRLLAIDRVTVSSTNGTTNTGSGNSNGNSKNRSHAFTGSADSSQADSTATGDDTPPGEPEHRSNFQQFFADGGN